MSPNLKTYNIRLFTALAIYSAIVFSMRWLLGLTNNDILRHAITLAPVVPALAVLWAVLAFVRTLDEVQRAIALEALVISFIVVGFGTFTYGFLEIYLAYPVLPSIWVLPALGGVYGLAQLLVRRKFR